MSPIVMYKFPMHKFPTHKRTMLTGVMRSEYRDRPSRSRTQSIQSCCIGNEETQSLDRGSWNAALAAH